MQRVNDNARLCLFDDASDLWRITAHYGEPSHHVFEKFVWHGPRETAARWFDDTQTNVGAARNFVQRLKWNSRQEMHAILQTESTGKIPQFLFRGATSQQGQMSRFVDMLHRRNLLRQAIVREKAALVKGQWRGGRDTESLS
jgi:hypothetical protein